MASEIRVDKINSLSGVGTVTLSPTGVDIAGITTAATLRATTGIITSLTAGSLTSLGAVSGTTGTFSAAVSGTTGTFSGDITANGNITGDGSTDLSGINDATVSALLVGDSIVHTGDTDTKIRFPSADIISFENGAGGETARFSATNQFSVNTTADVDGVNVAIGGSVRLVNATGQSATITALPSGSYNTGVSGGSAIVFHRFSDAGGGSDEIAFETHHQGTRHGEAARFNKSGNLVFPSGQGIDFSATADGTGSSQAEILDDYEEGTWTFAITPGGGSYQYNYGQTGYYSKIGNKVFINAWIHLIVSSSVSGSITLSGLPFACQNASRNWIPVGGYGQSSVSAASGLWLVLTNNGSTGSFTYNNSTFSGTTQLTAGNLGNSSELYINGCYLTAS